MYIYGIINANTKFFWGKNDISFNKKVYTVSYQDISAIVNDAEIVDYTRLNKEFLVRLLLGHQSVLEEVMSREYTTVPVRLGTFTADKNEIMNILTEGYTKIKNIFNRIYNKIEIDVVALWNDFNSVLKEIGEEKEVKEFKESVIANSKGVTFDDQVRIGIIVKNALNQKNEHYALQIRNTLKTVSQEHRVHECMNDNMILNMAFLVYKTRLQEFDRKIEDLNSQFNGKLNFKCIGPLPPYSFDTLEIRKIDFKEIDDARKKLGLNKSRVNKEEIKKAYYKSSLVYHPDRISSTPGIENEFNSLRKAYEILSEYCLNVQPEGNNDSFSLDEGDFVKNAFIIKIRE